jgi:hypothetical protein
MKKIYTLSIALLSAISSFAYYEDSKLSITYLGRGDVKVAVDGRRYDDGDQTTVINNLRPGYHTVKITRTRKTRRGGWWNNDETIYSNSVYVKPQTFVDITINRFGKAFVDEQLQDRNGRWNDDNDDERWNNDDRNRDDDWRNNGDRNGGYNNGMRKETFDALKQTLRNEPFDDKKLSIAKQVVRDNYISSAQVKELLQQFAFENNKLDFAKYAYQYVSDRGNYFIVYDAFTFSNSKDELARYIQNYR